MSDTQLKVHKIYGDAPFVPFGAEQQSKYYYVADDGSFWVSRVRLGEFLGWVLIRYEDVLNNMFRAAVYASEPLAVDYYKEDTGSATYGYIRRLPNSDGSEPVYLVPTCRNSKRLVYDHVPSIAAQPGVTEKGHFTVTGLRSSSRNSYVNSVRLSAAYGDSSTVESIPDERRHKEPVVDESDVEEHELPDTTGFAYAVLDVSHLVVSKQFSYKTRDGVISGTTTPTSPVFTSHDEFGTYSARYMDSSFEQKQESISFTGHDFDIQYDSRTTVSALRGLQDDDDIMSTSWDLSLAICERRVVTDNLNFSKIDFPYCNPTVTALGSYLDGISDFAGNYISDSDDIGDHFSHYIDEHSSSYNPWSTFASGVAKLNDDLIEKLDIPGSVDEYGVFTPDYFTLAYDIQRYRKILDGLLEFVKRAKTRVYKASNSDVLNNCSFNVRRICSMLDIPGDESSADASAIRVHNTTGSYALNAGLAQTDYDVDGNITGKGYSICEFYTPQNPLAVTSNLFRGGAIVAEEYSVTHVDEEVYERQRPYRKSVYHEYNDMSFMLTSASVSRSNAIVRIPGSRVSEYYVEYGGKLENGVSCKYGPVRLMEASTIQGMQDGLSAESVSGEGLNPGMTVSGLVDHASPKNPYVTRFEHCLISITPDFKYK